MRLVNRLLERLDVVHGAFCDPLLFDQLSCVVEEREAFVKLDADGLNGRSQLCFGV